MSILASAPNTGTYIFVVWLMFECIVCSIKLMVTNVNVSLLLNITEHIPVV